MDCYTAYRDDWKYVDEIETVSFFPIIPSTGLPKINEPVQAKAHKANPSFGGFGDGGLPAEGRSQNWILWSATLENTIPQAGTYFVTAGGEKWWIQSAVLAVFGTRWAVAAELQAPSQVYDPGP